MLEFLTVCRYVVRVVSSVNEKVSQNPEIAVEIVDLFFGQVSYLKHIDFVVGDE